MFPHLRYFWYDSKPITTHLFCLLKKKGKIGLNDDLSGYVGKMSEKSKFSFSKRRLCAPR